MKKILLFILFIFISLDSSYACKYIPESKETPKDFKLNCYTDIWYLKTNYNWTLETTCWYKTLKINSWKLIDVFISENKIIPSKLYKSAWWDIDFKINNLNWSLDFLKDNNSKTYNIYDEEKTSKAIKIEFNEILKAWTYEFNFLYYAKYRNAEIQISKDWISYYPINKYSLSDYDIKYINISFNSSVKNATPPEKIQISELSFKSKNYIYLIKVDSPNITAYSNNLCQNNSPNLSNNNFDFNINKSTQTFNLDLKDNTTFNPNKIEDSDNDWIENSYDNCKNIYNPKQKDKDWNWIWDLCSDDDKDGIIWDKDNCIYTYNPNQKDINRNWVWDKCEFDKDKDWIFDKLDNCINISNVDQLDTDKDWIWNACDNSIYYNPRQLDKNNNWIWDITEEREKNLKENDNDEDWIINYKDNCKNIANPDQLDTDKDWIWNACDNCSNYQNKNQLDFNKNWVWDICEDSDNDGIEWLTDNCINIANPNQKDTDNDWIWDVCEDNDKDNILMNNDNCPYNYNPDQKDVDKDWVWDICDSEDNRYIESNSNFFIWLLMFIILIFGGWIFLMIRKLK